MLVDYRAKNYLIDFCIATNSRYKSNWHLELIANELEKIAKNEVNYKILMLFLPPRHGKSELATINFPAWYLGRNPEKEIITASYSSDLALDFGSKTRTLVNSDVYKGIFETRLKQDEQNKAKWKTNKGGSYTSVGVGGATTGRGADVFIIDDPIKNREEADSLIYRDKVWSWFTSTAYTRLHPNGKVVVILTRWHLDDLAGRLIKNTGLVGLIKVINFPAIAQEDEKYRLKGEALWPSRYNLNDLEQIKLTIGSYDWSALYQQNPIATENQEFRQEWFKKITWQEVERFDTRKYLTIDTAVSQKSSGDYTGITENYINNQNKWHFKSYQMKLNPKELIDYIFTLQEKRQFEKIGIEKTIYLDALKPFIDEEMRKRNKFLPLFELKHNQISKETRIRGLIPRYQSGSIYHIDNECLDLEEQLLTFPKCINDDVLDSAAYQLQISESFKDETPAFEPDYKPISKYDLR